MKSRDKKERFLRIIEALDERKERQIMKKNADAVPLTSIIGAIDRHLGRCERILERGELPPVAMLREVRNAIRTHELLRQIRALKKRA